ncbi:MAG TPA: DUF445 family protein [Bacillales bacterium]|nr:DUF445 family protein [Bacillales bacterium]
MEILIELIFLIVIGALIGGVTNSLAIKMLFRPYHPIYIGRWRLPLTPGLIPKRREDLAEQLGKTVMEHLLTPESIQRKLHDADFQEEVLQWAKKQAREVLESEESLQELMERQFGVAGLKEKADGQIEAAVRAVFESRREYTIEEVIPGKWREKADEMIPALAAYIAEEGALFVESPEGRFKLQLLIEQFLSGRGMLSNMLQMFLGGDSLGDKVQAELAKLLRKPMLRDMIEQLLETQWGKLKRKQVGEFPVENISADISTFVKKEWPLNQWLESPLKEWTAPHHSLVIETWIPRMVDWAGRTVTAKVGELLRHLRLEEVVKTQVETFAVARLEELVLSISRREFKMITYLGALLGGVIGLVQGLLIQLFA